MLKGIDVSEHNANIDFAKVKESGINFVIIRIGWIGNKENHTLDKKFLQNYKNAKANGLSIGLYVFNYCTSESAVKSGANWVIRQMINNNIQINKPVFLDMEDDTNQTPLLHTYGKNKLTNISKMFCDTLELNKIPAGIYANLNWFKNYLDINILKEYKIWLAQWGNTYSKDFKVDLWQYADNGKVNGINGNVDMNYCLNCKEVNQEEITGQVSNNGGDFEVKTWRNGTTNETVYQDLACTNKIGTIYPREYAECYGIIDGKYLVVYYITDSTGKVIGRKAGFVKYNGGIK